MITVVTITMTIVRTIIDIGIVVDNDDSSNSNNSNNDN